MSQYTERNLIIGLIASTEFIERIADIYNVKLIESPSAKRIAVWCNEYYKEFKTAPGKHIESIFYEKAKTLPQATASNIEDILSGLSDQFEDNSLNIDYLISQTRQYFSQRNLTLFKESLEDLLEQDKVVEAEALMTKYEPLAVIRPDNWTDFSDPKSLEKVAKAFQQSSDPLIRYERALGEFWNHQLVRGGFVALLAPEKRGKTFWMLDMSIRAARQGRKVAFFQAGDMTENEQIIRIGIHLTGKSNKEQYTGDMLEPVRDCTLNQLNQCKFKERECDFGPFPDKNEQFVRGDVSYDELKEAWDENQDYRPCTNCSAFNKNKWGCVWMKQVNVPDVLDEIEAQAAYEKFFIKYKRRFRVATYPNNTLSVAEINSVLDLWDKDGFQPDVIFVDYADILIAPDVKEFRHRQNQIWMDLRATSQRRKALLVTATQADADSYTNDTLSLKNFSEDKRKYGHVTAMWGLNQDYKGREKKLGLMRLNGMVFREDALDITNQVHVLMNLRRGKPVLSSYW